VHCDFVATVFLFFGIYLTQQHAVKLGHELQFLLFFRRHLHQARFCFDSASGLFGRLASIDSKHVSFQSGRHLRIATSLRKKQIIHKDRCMESSVGLNAFLFFSNFSELCIVNHFSLNFHVEGETGSSLFYLQAFVGGKE